MYITQAMIIQTCGLRHHDSTCGIRDLRIHPNTSVGFS